MPRTMRDKAADFGDILAALGQSATGEAPACPVVSQFEIWQSASLNKG